MPLEHQEKVNSATISVVSTGKHPDWLEQMCCLDRFCLVLSVYPKGHRTSLFSGSLGSSPVTQENSAVKGTVLGIAFTSVKVMEVLTSHNQFSISVHGHGHIYPQWFDMSEEEKAG